MELLTNFSIEAAVQIALQELENDPSTQLRGTSTRSDRGPLQLGDLNTFTVAIDQFANRQSQWQHREKGNNSCSSKRCFHSDDKPRPLFFFVLRCYSFENTQRIRGKKEIHINQIKFWLFHYKMTTAVCQILRTLLLRKEKPTTSVTKWNNASRQELSKIERTRSDRREAQKRKAREIFQQVKCNKNHEHPYTQTLTIIFTNDKRKLLYKENGIHQLMRQVMPNASD